ncbi:MAG: PIG-L family deacetylase [Deltaproteobacteria bacterium]|nr:MAG: PIG-L family deacetylase [Deltaproteobacteria bacterium]
MKRVLCAAIHPDDETLGCGGTLLRHKAQGDEIHWLLMTNVHEGGRWPADFVVRRQREIAQVTERYRFDGFHPLDYPTTTLDARPFGEIVTAVGKVIEQVQPEVIYLPNRADVHTDHQVTFRAVYNCTKHFRYPSIRRVLMYETLSETEFAPALRENAFVPNVFVDISPHFEEKLEIMQIYASEVMPPPGPRSLAAIEALARLRGSRIGATFAEAFMLLFEMS